MMRKQNVKRVFPLALTALLMVAGLMGCSKKNDPGPGSGNGFKITDIQISNIVAEQERAGSQVHVAYDVKNVSGKDMVDYSPFDILWTVKTTDGTLYQQERSISALKKDAVSPDDVWIGVSAGKVADLSTLKYEVLLDE
ncbi:hypothetical protein [Chitinophaga alhagiae]|uniref:hypothetical protein n=1 Tax=Chitinophaga alhagiae TaxID=2203219 RepID=UPI000E5B093B|nr:hypothetical protein [Chitinophaga alhagiae]